MAIIMMAMTIQQFIMTMTTCKECAPLLLSKQDPMQSPFLISFDQMFILLWIINDTDGTEIVMYWVLMMVYLVLLMMRD